MDVRCSIPVFPELTRPLLFAHRAGAGAWPENTPLAFAQCQRLGGWIVETDVRTTRDQQLVVFHDERLERVTNGRGRVSDHDVAELKRLDAAHWFTPDGRHYPWRGAGEQIPTLDELVSAFPDSRFNIELKGGGSAPALMWRAIERHRLHDRVLIAAADDRLMQAFRALARGRVPTSASRREAARFLAAHAVRASRVVRVGYQALQLPLTLLGRSLARPPLIEAIHRRGLQLHIWTVNARSDMRRLLELGVDGIMTDYPDRLILERDRYQAAAQLATARRPTEEASPRPSGAAASARGSPGSPESRP